MITYKTLEGIDLHILHSVFLEAFSDYQVKMELSFESFCVMMKRRLLDQSLSIGAFEEDALVGFIFIGSKTSDSIRIAYDTGTGVLPSHRRLGITTAMIEFSFQVLKDAEIDDFYLEVLQENEAAFNLYKKHGFKITREFNCFKLEHRIGINPCVNLVRGTLTDIDTSFWDFVPSWQNSVEAIMQTAEDFYIAVARHDSQVVGYGVIHRQSGDIPLLAVHKEFRKRGIAKEILFNLQENTVSSTLSLINVDASAHTMNEMLKHLEFTLTLRQYEMKYEVHK